MAAAAVAGLSCVLCERTYAPEDVLYACPSCGPLGTLRVHCDYRWIAPEFQPRRLPRRKESLNMWRYYPLLPVGEGWRRFPLPVGWTPLTPAPRLRRALGLRNLHLKDDTRNPTASLKDRASAVAVVRALEAGYPEVACASTGNAAASLAGLAAAAGLSSRIFLPASAPRAKVAQLLAYGSTVYSIQGSYDQAFDLCVQACQRFGWYCRNTGYNPYMVEGKKTVALEIAEQLGWRCPDKVVVPVGDGCIISGVWKGFWDLYQLGITDRLPQLIAVQAEGSQAIRLALEGDGQLRPVKARTIADSISVDLPRNGAMAVQDIRASGGLAVAVSDEEIMHGVLLLARQAGIFVEPAAGASLAGLLKLLEANKVGASETVVLLATGGGLKDVDSVLKATDAPAAVAPALGAIVRRVEQER